MNENLRLKIEYLPLDALTPYINNARKHEADDVATIKESIKSFEMCDPIGIWSDKNIIVEGHGRLLALQELGYKEAPCIRLDHLSDHDRKAYALAHNKTAENSAWDFSRLENELDDLSGLFDMTAFGFPEQSEPIDIDDFFEDAEPKEKEPKMITCPHCGLSFEE